MPSSSLAARIAEEVASLPPEKQGAVPPDSGDAAWERIIGDPHPRPKLDAFVESAIVEKVRRG